MNPFTALLLAACLVAYAFVRMVGMVAAQTTVSLYHYIGARLTHMAWRATSALLVAEYRLDCYAYQQRPKRFMLRRLQQGSTADYCTYRIRALTTLLRQTACGLLDHAPALPIYASAPASRAGYCYCPRCGRTSATWTTWSGPHLLRLQASSGRHNAQ